MKLDVDLKVGRGQLGLGHVPPQHIVGGEGLRKLLLLHDQEFLVNLHLALLDGVNLWAVSASQERRERERELRTSSNELNISTSRPRCTPMRQPITMGFLSGFLGSLLTLARVYWSLRGGAWP